MGAIFSSFMPTRDPLEDLLTPEELQRQRVFNSFESARPQGFVPAMVSALDALRNIPQQAPTLRTLSGGDVIGLMPEQTAGLLDRLQKSNIIDQQMYEARQAEMRDEQRVREGRIMSAREAQARREQELAIENAKIQREQAEEERKRRQPKITPITGTNQAYREEIGADGMPVVSVVPIGGETVAQKPAAQKYGWVLSDDGKTKRYLPLSEGMEQAAESPLTQKETTQLIREGAKFYQNYGRNEGGKIVPISIKEAMEISRKEIAGEEFSLDGLVELKEPKYREVTHEDGSVTWEEVTPGEQVKPAKPDGTKDPFQYLQRTFGVKWQQGDKQTMANALAQAGFTEQDAKDTLGDPVNENWFWWDSTNYTFPGGAPTPPAMPTPSGSFDMKYDPATGTFK